MVSEQQYNRRLEFQGKTYSISTVVAKLEKNVEFGETNLWGDFLVKVLGIPKKDIPKRPEHVKLAPIKQRLEWKELVAFRGTLIFHIIEHARSNARPVYLTIKKGKVTRVEKKQLCSSLIEKICKTTKRGSNVASRRAIGYSRCKELPKEDQKSLQRTAKISSELDDVFVAKILDDPNFSKSKKKELLENIGVL